MKLLQLILSFIFLTAVSANAAQNFCSVEVRVCGSDLQGGSARCGYNGAVAFVTCGKDDFFKITANNADSLKEKVNQVMINKNMKPTANLNKKDIYVKSNSAVSDANELCYAELKVTEVGSTFFDPQIWLANGYTIECSNASALDNITLRELSSFTTSNQDVTNGLSKITKALISTMHKQGYKTAQYLPLNVKEKYHFLLDEEGLMFTSGDSRYLGFIFIRN